MRVDVSSLNPYARAVSRSAARTGATVDLTAAAGSAPTSSARPLSDSRPDPELGALQGVLTPEESRLIADLFPRQEGGGGAKVGHGYTSAGRPVSGSIPGARLDLKG